uniref:Type II cadherin n=1 Tax=Ciona savignyi TaxID=51511 RepID=Q95YK9_CIOSA|nr:type II cadherin [Ciona savignyi]
MKTLVLLTLLSSIANAITTIPVDVTKDAMPGTVIAKLPLSFTNLKFVQKEDRVLLKIAKEADGYVLKLKAPASKLRTNTVLLKYRLSGAYEHKIIKLKFNLKMLSQKHNNIYRVDGLYKRIVALRSGSKKSKVLSRQKRWEFNSYSVSENREDQLIARLRSSYDNYTGTVIYSISGRGADSLFQIEPLSGHLFLKQKLDREMQSSYKLNVSAHDGNGVPLEPASEITIDVLDENDNPPEFAPGPHHARVKERSPSGTKVADVIARDADDPQQPYGQIRYSLLPSPGDATNKFMIHHERGTVSTITSNLDREESATYELVIQARDDPNARLSFSATTTLTISVIDVNDSPPVFVNEPYKPIVAEDAKIGSEIVRLSTTDADVGENAQSIYVIEDGDDSAMFSIEAIDNLGVLKVKKRLDYETAPDHKYSVRVRARNTHPDPNLAYLGSMDDVTDVVITVTDVNEPPEFTEVNYEFSVREDAIRGFPIRAVTAVDPEGDSFSYFLRDESKRFAIDAVSGMISVAGELDRELQATYDVTVYAGSPGDLDFRSTARVTISISDVNDNPPHPLDGDTVQVVLCDNQHEKGQILHPKIKFTDPDSPINGQPFTYYSTEHDNYKHFELVNNDDGTASLRTAHRGYSSSIREYELPVIVEDNGSPKLNATYTITVRACHCTESGKELCGAAALTGAVRFELLLIILGVVVLFLVFVVILITVRRRRHHRAELLLKASISSSEDDVRENIISYNEEGGGEEDTAAFDLSALQRDYCSSSSGSQFKHRLDFSSPPSTKVSTVPPYVPPLNGVSPDIRDFINGRKEGEDVDDSRLAFDSLQIYAYEGEGSDAGSLSSLASGSDDSDQNYDYLRDWGPRFDKLANIYGSGRPQWSDGECASVSPPTSYLSNRGTMGRRKTAL